jgi:hypothetical protein
LLPGIGDEFDDVDDLKYSENHNSLPEIGRSPNNDRNSNYHSNNSRIQVGYGNMVNNSSIDSQIIRRQRKEMQAMHNHNGSVPLSRARSKETLP